jgi:hypothetical protein
MRTIYGLKMFTLEDIINNIGGRPAICNFLKENSNILDKFDDDEIIVLDTGIHENFPIYNMAKSMKFVFVSIDLLEERLILDNMVTNVEEVSKLFVTANRTEKVERIVNKYNDSYERYAESNSGEVLMKKSCFMFVYDNDEHKLMDVFTAIPANVVALLTEPIEYKCDVCGKIEEANNTSFDNFMPDMYYKVIDNKIDYRCPAHKEDDYSHVGE